MIRAVTVFAPATIARLGPGLDVLALALDGPGDTVSARFVDGAGVRLEDIEGDEGQLPLGSADNAAAIAAAATLRRAGVSAGIALRLRKGLPVSAGLGGAAASAAASALAVNLLLGSPLRKSELIEPCLEAETRVSGEPHADNAAAALLGGLVLVRSVAPVDVVRLATPVGLAVAVAHPQLRLEARARRDARPSEVPLRALVENSANLAAMVLALHTGDITRLQRAMSDATVSPGLAALIPGGPEALAAALDRGAIGSSISGSGPSLAALCRSLNSAREVGEAMRAAFARRDVAAEILVSPADSPGARKVS